MDMQSPLQSPVAPRHLEMGAPVIVPSLLSIAKSTRAFLALLLAEIDLHPGQDQLLDRLDPNAPISVSALAEQLAVRPSTVSKMLDRLIEKGLVARIANSRDARRTMVQLTPLGEQAQTSIRNVWRRLETDLVASIPADDLAILDRSLARTGELLTQKLRRLR
ncbi:MarR family winged helix-turn-helix transcriptional regulator [Aurantimonas aggregata]|uniref:MarR family winged helix-turn-helix transcriptional regulator n=1 Tax=Aurantimonas aggregata TaxID=2047720 RepID=UPI001FE67F63|nr:MarR family transcriptional regulator [Aurantimonas aggregata]